MSDHTIAVYIEVAKEHRASIETARRIVAFAGQHGQRPDALAAALVAIDEAMAASIDGSMPSDAD